MDVLTEILSNMVTPASMAEAEVDSQRRLECELSTRTKNLIPLPPDPATDVPFPSDVNGVRDRLRRLMEGKSLHLQYPPPITLPCANVQPTSTRFARILGQWLVVHASSFRIVLRQVHNKPLPISL
jgi:hypothetical protein